MLLHVSARLVAVANVSSMKTAAIVLACLVCVSSASRLHRRSRNPIPSYKEHYDSQPVHGVTSSFSLAEVEQSQEQVLFNPMKALATILVAYNQAGIFDADNKELSFQLKNTPIIYINLDNRTDRRQRMEDQLAQHGLEATRYEALTGVVVTNAVIHRSWQPGMHAKFDIRQEADSWHFFSEGERGCAGSHVTLWQLCVKENLPIIVLEDDAVFGDDFLRKLQQAMRHIADRDPTLLYFQTTVAEWGSYRKLITPDLEIRDVRYASEAGGYAIWPQTASVLLRNLPMREPLDSFVARLSHEGKIRTYACSPSIIRQFDQLGDSDIPRTGIMSDEKFYEKMRTHMKVDQKPKEPTDTVQSDRKSEEAEVKEEIHEDKDSNTHNIIFINMAARPDRRERLEAQFTKHGLSAERFEAVTGETTEDAIIDRNWQPGLNAKFDIRQKEDEWHTLSVGERGCAGSHAILWRRCVSENRPMVIIEDDAVLDDDFVNKLERGMEFISEHDPSFLYLQSNVAEWGDYTKVITPKMQIRSVHYVWETGGYVIWPETAAILLDNLPMHQPVDDYLAKMAYTGVIRQYATSPAIITQFDQAGDSDIAHTGVMSKEDFQAAMLYRMQNKLPPFN